MKKIIALFILLFFIVAPVSAGKNKIYLVEIKFDKGAVSFGEVTSQPGYAQEVEKQERMSQYRYWIEIISFAGQVLEKRQFSINPMIYPEPPIEGESSEGGPIMLEQFEHSLSLPYYPNGKTMNLYGANRQRLDVIDISYLAQTCGDGECQETENESSCPDDCIQKQKTEKVTQQKIVDSTQERVVSKNNTLIIVLLCVLVLGLIITGLLVLLKVGSKNKKKPEYPENYDSRYDIEDKEN